MVALDLFNTILQEASQHHQYDDHLKGNTIEIHDSQYLPTDYTPKTKMHAMASFPELCLVVCSMVLNSWPKD